MPRVRIIPGKDWAVPVCLVKAMTPDVRTGRIVFAAASQRGLLSVMGLVFPGIGVFLPAFSLELQKFSVKTEMGRKTVACYAFAGHGLKEVLRRPSQMSHFENRTAGNSHDETSMLASECPS